MTAPSLSTAAEAAHLELQHDPDGALVVRVAGTWAVGRSLPSAELVVSRLAGHHVPALRYDAAGLGGWDTTLLVFTRAVEAAAAAQRVVTDRSGLPSGLQRLLTLIESTPVDEFARWSAPLGALVADAIAENLMSYLAAGGVRTHPWSAADRPNVSVRIAIQQFEPVAPDSAVLRARWEVVDADGQPLGEPQASHHRTAAPAGPKAEALALSRLLGLLAADIAGVVRSVDVTP